MPVPSRLTGVSYVEGVEVIQASIHGDVMDVQSMSGQVRGVMVSVSLAFIMIAKV
jgi:hypothetical protein